MPDEAEHRDDGVTPIRKELSPADAADAIAAEEIPLRDVATALPRIASELARSNALTAQSIRLQQMQIALLTDCVRAIQTAQTSGVELQRAQLDLFGGLFGPLAGLLNAEASRLPSPPPPPVPPEIQTHTKDGVKVTVDPAELQEG